MIAVVAHHAWAFRWFTHFFGIDNEPGPFYAFWSGFGSDIGEVVLIGGLVQIYRAHTCHDDRCWRLARHPVDGTPYKACKKHHPTVPDQVTADHMARAHREAQHD